MRRAHDDDQSVSVSAQEKLLEIYGGAIKRYLLTALRDEATAHDLYQEFALHMARLIKSEIELRRAAAQLFITEDCGLCKMEIIVLPYLAISFLIAWAVFSPFALIDDLHEWKFARIETSDLFAIFLPFSFLLGIVTWVTSVDAIPVLGWISIAAAIFLFTLSCLVAGLFLLEKLNRAPSIKRIALIGVVIPMGSLLTLTWFVIPFAAFASSILFAIPAAAAIVPVTFALRVLSIWVCRSSEITKR